MNSVLIIDYQMGNVDSMKRALEECGAQVTIGNSDADFQAASHVVLPGVGAFPSGMANLRRLGLLEKIQTHVVSGGLPLLGVCLGMQLLAESGTEGEPCPGIGLIPGTVTPLVPNGSERIPHVGWNSLLLRRESALFAGVAPGSDFYFVHSFHLECAENFSVIAMTDYCGGFCSAVNRGNIWGTQFHPEKSQVVGMKVLRNFLSLS